jgi:hypothetical protein
MGTVVSSLTGLILGCITGHLDGERGGLSVSVNNARLTTQATIAVLPPPPSVIIVVIIIVIVIIVVVVVKRPQQEIQLANVL